MLNKLIVRIEYAFIIFFLILGLLVSSIGVAWCRYQVSTSKPITFKVKGASEYYISNQQEWEYDYNQNVHELSFQVSNTLNRQKIPTTSSHFHVRLSMSEQVQVSLYVLDLSGKETKYESKIYGEQHGVYEYGFVDYDHELELELKGNNVSIQSVRLEIEGMTDAFLSEVMIIDASYDVEKGQYYSSSPSIPLEVTSNYLSDTLDHTVFITDSAEITLKSNFGLKSTVSIETSSESLDASINNGVSLNITLEPDAEYTVTLDVTTFDDEEYDDGEKYVNVYWKLYDDNDEVLKTYKAKFLILKGQVSSDTQPTITTVPTQNIFSQYMPIQVNMTSDIDTVVTLVGDTLFPAYTKYSLDEGKSWYILSEENVIEVALKEKIAQNVIIDFKDTEMEWTEDTYNMYTYYNDELLNTLVLDKKVNDIELLTTSINNLGVIHKNEKVSFDMNVSDVSLSLEYYGNNTYKEINKDDYLYWNMKNENQTVEITTKDNIPLGTYRIKVTQINNNVILCEKYLSFFVIDTQE